jgi:flagellar assembly protein FliH
MATRNGPVRKYAFERSFDDPSKLYLPSERRKSEIAAEEAAMAAAEAAAAETARKNNVRIEPAEPKVKVEFTKAQVEAAREEGYIAGHGAALEEAGTSREHYVADAINLIAQGLAKLDEQQQAVNVELEKVAMRMVYGIVRRILPGFAEQYAVDNIEGFVRQVLPVAVSEPKILVRAHPMITADIETRLKDVFARASFQGAYTVITDYELQPGDCRLEWAGGGADRDEARIWRSVREAVAASYGDVDVDVLDATVDAAIQQEQAEHLPVEQAPAEQEDVIEQAAEHPADAEHDHQDGV